MNQHIVNNIINDIMYELNKQYHFSVECSKYGKSQKGKSSMLLPNKDGDAVVVNKRIRKKKPFSLFEVRIRNV